MSIVRYWFSYLAKETSLAATECIIIDIITSTHAIVFTFITTCDTIPFCAADMLKLHFISSIHPNNLPIASSTSRNIPATSKENFLALHILWQKFNLRLSSITNNKGGSFETLTNRAIKRLVRKRWNWSIQKLFIGDLYLLNLNNINALTESLHSLQQFHSLCLAYLAFVVIKIVDNFSLTRCEGLIFSTKNKKSFFNPCNNWKLNLIFYLV